MTTKQTNDDQDIQKCFTSLNEQSEPFNKEIYIQNNS